MPARRSLAVAAAAALVAVGPIGLVGPRTASADRGDPDGGTVVGLGFGPGARLAGPLADRFTADGGSGRIRFGLRVGRLGLELATTVVGLQHAELGPAGLVLATPTLGYYPVVHSHVQLAVRGGLGYGSISADRVGPPPACQEPPCPGPAREPVNHPGYGLDLGVSAAVHLGRRRGQRAIVWADLGVSLVRFQLADQVVAGRLVTFTVGIGHGIAM